MSNSSLVNCTVLSPNYNTGRKHAIDRITPHCIVGQMTAEDMGGYFKKKTTAASCNYGVDKDGRVLLCVEEANRSWCSSSSDNDNRAVTIEVASEKTEPYAFNAAAYNKLVDLCTDVCKRNGKNKLIWIEDKTAALAYQPAANEMLLTVHRWFKNKACPGAWMFARMGDLASTVTTRLGGSSKYPAVPFEVAVLITDLRIRKTPSTNGETNGVTGKGSFTIAEISGDWGRLKSGAGWIFLGNPSYVYIGGHVASAQPVVSVPIVNQPVAPAPAPVAPAPVPVAPAPVAFSKVVKVTVPALHIREGAGANYKAVGTIRDKGSYTITEIKNGWGKLKSGKGWIYLEYTK